MISRLIRLAALSWLLALSLFFHGCAGKTPPPKTAEIYFSEGQEAFESGNYEEAIEQWKKVKESYSSPELTATAELRIADAHFENKSYIEAAAAYEDFRKLHPNHEKVPYAIYRTALSYYNEITGFDRDQTPVKNALSLFQELVSRYPQADVAEDARKKVEELQLKQALHEIYVGRFYLRTKKYPAAINRLEYELATYPNLPVNDEALFYLGQAYILSGEKTKGRDAFIRLSQGYPNSKYVDQASKFLAKHY